VKEQTVTAVVLAAAALAALSQPALAQDAAPGKSPVKVFILAGQSNMEGHGVIRGRPNQKGTLETLAKDPASAARYKHLVDKDGKWVVRDDVWIRFYGNKGNLTVGGFAGRGAIGPKLGFGWAVGDYLDEQVLLIKFGPGGTSLAGPWRPPSSGGTEKKARGPGVGDEYDKMIAGVRKQLKNLKADFPDYDGRGCEIVGFGWHQGWNDGCSANLVAEYEKNMANFIRDVRKDLGVPKLPFVSAGGLGLCVDKDSNPIFASKDDPDYGRILDALENGVLARKQPGVREILAQRRVQARAGRQVGIPGS